MRTIVMVLLILSTMGEVAFAAEPDERARAATLLTQGVLMRAEGKDEEALELFRQSNTLDSTPKSLAQLGLCEQALGMWVTAEEHLQRALKSKGDPWIERNRVQLEGSLSRVASELGWVLVVDAPTGSTVRVDGAVAGTTPLSQPLRAAAGTRLLEVSAAGYESYTRRVNVRSGEVTRDRAVLVEQRKEEPAKAGATSAGGKSAPRYVEVPMVSPLRTGGWITFGAGVAAAVFGGAGLLVRQSYVDSYNSDQSCPGTASLAQPPQCQERKDGVTRWGTIGIVSLIGGGVLATTGLTLVLVAPSKTRVRVAGLELSCDGMGIGVQCKGAF